jgi:DNA sulfur modification protein DndE
MHNPIETIRIDQRNKNLLIQIKRKTKIQNWNTICRWAFLYSLQMEGKPNTLETKAENAVEMTWKVFSGTYSNLIWGLLKARVLNDSLPLEEDILKTQFKLHLYRGIQALSNFDYDDFTFSLIDRKMIKF